MNQLLRFQVQILLIFNLLICYNAVLQGRRCGRSTVRNFQGRTLTTTLRMCPLEQIFQEEFDKPVDNVVSAFFPSAQCTKMTRENDRVQRTFYCNQYNLILLSPRHLQFADSSDIVIKTSTTNYTDMHISIEGIVLDWNTKLRAYKMDGKLDFLISASNLYINSKDLLEKNFGISEEEMRVMDDVNKKNDFEIPTRLPNATLSVVFYPNKYFELMITDVQSKSFFVFQFYPNYVKPVAAYFRTSENVSPLDHLNKLFGIKLATGFSPFLELKNLVFSSSTSKINVIMDDYGRNTLEKFTTESARENIPSGKTIRWLIGDLMKIKLKSVNIVIPQSTSTKASKHRRKVVQQSKKQKSKGNRRKTLKKKANQNIPLSNNSSKLNEKGINIGSSIFAINQGLLKRSMEDENSSELSTEEENNSQESYEESNNEESFEESNNEESTEEGSSDSESTDKDSSSKRSETKTEDNQYSNNIAVELTLPKTSDGDIVITSPDYLKAPFQNLIVSFFPNLNLLVSAPFVAQVRIEEKTYKLTVPDKQVVFSKIVIKPLTKEVELVGVIDEDWKVAGGLVNLKGVNVSVYTKFPEIGESDEPWTFRANGDVPLFSKLITVQILNQDNDYIVTGDFQIENMTVLTSLFKDATFMNEKEIEAFSQPQQLAFEKLTINTPLKDPVLRIKATSAIHLTAERETLTNLKLEIIISSIESDEIKMILGLCGSNLNYAELMNQMFNLTLQGVSWLNFDNVCLLFSKESSNEVKYLSDPLMKNVEASGIHMCGNIKVHGNCDFKGNTDKFCKFLRSNSHIIEEAGLMCGSVTSTSHNLHGSSASTTFHQLSDGSLLQISESKISVESQNSGSLSRRETTEDSEDDYVQYNTRFVVTGKFKTELAPVISFIGNVLVGSSGELELQILEQFKWESPENIVVSRFSSGKSVIENDGVFNSFAVETSVKFGSVEDKRIEFEIKPLLLINLKEDNVYFIAHKNLASDSDTLTDLFKAFEKDSNGVLLNLNHAVHSRTTAVFINKDNVSIPELGDYVATKGLTLFGKLKRLIGISDYKITVDSASNFNYIESMSLLNHGNGKFVMSQSLDNTVNGPILLASSTENKKELQVTLKGYLQSIGVVKENAVLNLKNEGQFDINMDQDFFGEAPAKVIIQEKNGFKSYLDMKPIIHVDLMPGKRKIQKQVQKYFKSLIRKVHKTISKVSLNGLKFKILTRFGLEVMNISSAMLKLNDQIQLKLQMIQKTYDQFEKSCVEECNKERKVKIPGLHFDESSQKMVYTPTMYESIDVSCVAACESEKAVDSETLSQKIKDATIVIANFNRLEKKVYQLEAIYHGYSCAFKSEINLKEKLKKMLDVRGLHEEMLKLKQRKFFILRKFDLNKEINSIKIKSDKCVPNFKVHYEMFGKNYKIDGFEQCFNGEYGFFFAQKLVENYLGKETIDQYNLVIKENDAATAKFKALTILIRKSLKLVLDDYKGKKLNRVKKLLKQQQKQIDEYCASFETVEKRDNTMQINTNPGFVTFGENTYLLPVLKQADRSLLVKSKSCTTRSLSTRLAFMYSSPWAAIDVFDPKSSLSDANIKIQSIKSNLSQCDHTNAVINQYHGLYNTIHSLVDSYKESNLRVSSITKAIDDAVLIAKSKIDAPTENSTIVDSTFWFNQVERGMKVFADIASEKFKSYSSTAFQNVKTKYEDSLKRQGIPSLALYMDSLKKHLQLAFKKMQVPSMPASIGAVSATRLSNAFISMFNKPKLSLEDLGHYDLKLKKYISSVNHMSC